jgi:hypothetical protein
LRQDRIFSGGVASGQEILAFNSLMCLCHLKRSHRRYIEKYILVAV